MRIASLLHALDPRRPLTRVDAHCDVPCGVYNPAQARVEAESVHLIAKKYQDSDDEVFRQRCVFIKEERADLVKHHLWVLWTDYFKPNHLEEYPQLHDLFWRATKKAGEAKKSMDPAVGEELLGLIDEAYSLINSGYAGGDAFGAEAVQTLLKRAEDDRDRLVIILAGYEREMNRFLATNPGLASRFNQRIAFPSYSPPELARIAELLAERSGDRFDDQARRDLAEVFAWVCAEGLIDGLGNGRFARNLFERAALRRDVRLAAGEGTATPAELTTIISEDVRAAVEELSGR